MSETYLTTDQLAERIQYDARTIRTLNGALRQACEAVPIAVETDARHS